MAEPEIDLRSIDRLNEAVDLYENDRWRKCLEVCEDMLQDRGALCRNIRIRVLAMAAFATDDFWEAEERRKEAEVSIPITKAFGRTVAPFIWFGSMVAFRSSSADQRPG